MPIPDIIGHSGFGEDSPGTSELVLRRAASGHFRQVFEEIIQSAAEKNGNHRRDSFTAA